MPYIKQQARPDLDEKIERIVMQAPLLPAGELNYVLTRIVKAWIGTPGYARIATATGVIENVKQEMYRRLAAPYEDYKLGENGDVY